MLRLTDFGDLAVLAPLCAVMLIWLLATRSARAAAWWLAAASLCAGATAVLKIYFFACPIGADLGNPSGHTSFSALMYGGLTVVVAAELSSVWQRAGVIGGYVAFVIAMALSRLVLGAHSLLEVVAGVVIGVASLAVFAQHYLREKQTHSSLMLLMAAVIVLAAAFHGERVYGTQLLRAISWHLSLASLICS